MILSPETARQTAAHLLQIKAIKLQPENPFTWASGWKSPIYCDNRLTLSYPEIRKYLAHQMAAQIRTLYPTTEVVAGVATGAIALGILVAEELNLPFAYIRGKAKEHGRQNQIEGQIDPGQKAVVIEDLISTGGSSLQAVDALREANVTVLGMLAIFTYGFPVAEQNFERANCTLHTLSDYPHLLEQASATGYIVAEQVAVLQTWRKAPDKWGV
jgi:orotate phosphoribosyltransferase